MLSVKDTKGSFCLHGAQGLMKKKEARPSEYEVMTVVGTMRKGIWCYGNIFSWEIGKASLQSDARSLSERNPLGKGAAVSAGRGSNRQRSHRQGAWCFED